MDERMNGRKFKLLCCTLLHVCATKIRHGKSRQMGYMKCHVLFSRKKKMSSASVVIYSMLWFNFISFVLHYYKGTFYADK